MNNLLRAIAYGLRQLELETKAAYGTESDPYYRFLETAQHFDRLVDSVPGAREEILKGNVCGVIPPDRNRPGSH